MPTYRIIPAAPGYGQPALEPFEVEAEAEMFAAVIAAERLGGDDRWTAARTLVTMYPPANSRGLNAPGYYEAVGYQAQLPRGMHGVEAVGPRFLVERA